MHVQTWSLLKQAVMGFINDEALSRGAAMAIFAVTSLAPILLIVMAMAGLVFGRDAAKSALDDQLGSVMGDQSAQLIQSVTAGAANQTSGSWAAVIGIITLLVTASGVFGEMQSALNDRGGRSGVVGSVAAVKAGGSRRCVLYRRGGHQPLDRSRRLSRAARGAVSRQEQRWGAWAARPIAPDNRQGPMVCLAPDQCL
jgi:hypothetical protein